MSSSSLPQQNQWSCSYGYVKGKSLGIVWLPNHPPKMPHQQQWKYEKQATKGKFFGFLTVHIDRYQLKRNVSFFLQMWKF